METPLRPLISPNWLLSGLCHSAMRRADCQPPHRIETKPIIKQESDNWVHWLAYDHTSTPWAWLLADYPIMVIQLIVHRWGIQKKKTVRSPAVGLSANHISTSCHTCGFYWFTGASVLPLGRRWTVLEYKFNRANKPFSEIKICVTSKNEQIIIFQIWQLGLTLTLTESAKYPTWGFKTVLV